MGPAQVQSLIGRWIGRDHDHDHHDRDRHDRDRDRDRDRGYPYGYPQYGYPGYAPPSYTPPPSYDYPQYGYGYSPQPDFSRGYYSRPKAPVRTQQPFPPATRPGSGPVFPGSIWHTKPQGVTVRDHRLGSWYDIESGGGGNPLLPRAAVVDAPLPTQANRDILPMSTGVPILPTQSAQITGRPQTLVFKIGRFMISNAGTAGGAADWIVNDIKIGNRSQFVQSGDVPGDLFATNAIDTFVRFEAAQTAMDVVVVVTYIGLNESGCPFFGAMVGTAAV